MIHTYKAMEFKDNETWITIPRVKFDKIEKEISDLKQTINKIESDKYFRLKIHTDTKRYENRSWNSYAEYKYDEFKRRDHNYKEFQYPIHLTHNLHSDMVKDIRIEVGRIGKEMLEQFIDFDKELKQKIKELNDGREKFNNKIDLFNKCVDRIKRVFWFVNWKKYKFND